MNDRQTLKLLMQENIQQLSKASDQLALSLTRCEHIDISSNRLTIDQQEKLEALTSRFARLTDLITQKTLRLIEQIELENIGSLLDRINKAEKKGLIKSAVEFIEIRQLRNSITHDYDIETLNKIFQSCIKYAPTLIASVQSIKNYIDTKQLASG